MYNKYTGRFKDAPWYKNSTKESVLLVGAGGIGSNSLYCLTKTIPACYYVVDHDRVDSHNIGTQFFTKDQVGKLKLEALSDNCKAHSDCHIRPITRHYSAEYMPIIITGLDNMAGRKQVFDEWKKREDRELLIDGRLRANLYEIYVVTKGREAEYEATLFDDKDADDGPCTFKQTAYFGMLIGARITHVLVNYLTNKYAEEPVCTLPFKIQEFGEPFYIEVN